MCKKNDLNNAFEEFIMQRIVEIEKVKSNQTDFQKIEEKIIDLQKILTECTHKNGLEDTLKELINLQLGQVYDMYHAIYAQGFSDAMQFPNLLNTTTAKIHKTI